ncbi:hypothetical protein JCM10207_003782 [Rhodosporidiobolus poonsookiae]
MRYMEAVKPLMEDILLHYIASDLVEGHILNPHYPMRGSHASGRRGSRFQHFPSQQEIRELVVTGTSTEVNLGFQLMRPVPKLGGDYNPSYRNRNAHPIGDEFRTFATLMDSYFGSDAWKNAFQTFLNSPKGQATTRFGDRAGFGSNAQEADVYHGTEAPRNSRRPFPTGHPSR